MRDRRLHVLAGIAVACMLAFLFIGLRGNIGFAVELRLTRLAALVEVAIAIAVSTVLFQTVTGNRILTPSIMGLDALYVFGQLLLILLIGGLGFAALDARLKFGGAVVLLMTLSCTLLFPILKMRIDMGLMLLAGVVLGVLFRSLATLVARLIDPNEFAVAQHATFANFNDVETDLLAVSTVLTVACVAIAWRMRHSLDVLLLGRESAIGLGVDWLKNVTGLLLLVAALVSVSTALVGPVAFLGLLVAARTRATGSHAQGHDGHDGCGSQCRPFVTHLHGVLLMRSRDGGVPCRTRRFGRPKGCSNRLKRLPVLFRETCRSC